MKMFPVCLLLILLVVVSSVRADGHVGVIVGSHGWTEAVRPNAIALTQAAAAAGAGRVAMAVAEHELARRVPEFLSIALLARLTANAADVRPPLRWAELVLIVSPTRPVSAVNASTTWTITAAAAAAVRDAALQLDDRGSAPPSPLSLDEVFASVSTVVAKRSPIDFAPPLPPQLPTEPYADIVAALTDVDCTTPGRAVVGLTRRAVDRAAEIYAMTMAEHHRRRSDGDENENENEDEDGNDVGDEEDAMVVHGRAAGAAGDLLDELLAGGGELVPRAARDLTALSGERLAAHLLDARARQEHACGKRARGAGSGFSELVARAVARGLRDGVSLSGDLLEAVRDSARQTCARDATEFASDAYVRVASVLHDNTAAARDAAREMATDQLARYRAAVDRATRPGIERPLSAGALRTVHLGAASSCAGTFDARFRDTSETVAPVRASMMTEIERAWLLAARRNAELAGEYCRHHAELIANRHGGLAATLAGQLARDGTTADAERVMTQMQDAAEEQFALVVGAEHARATSCEEARASIGATMRRVSGREVPPGEDMLARATAVIDGVRTATENLRGIAGLEPRGMLMGTVFGGALMLLLFWPRRGKRPDSDHPDKETT